MRVWGVLVVAMTLCVPQIASAVEGRLGVRGSSQYNTNLFRQDRDPKDDFLFRFSPTIGFSQDEGRFSWDTSYRPTYVDHLEFSERDKWNHTGNGRGSYLLGPRTRLSFFDRVTFSENSPNKQESPNSPGASDVNTSTRRTLRNSFGLSLSHGISSRLSWSASATHALSDVSGGDRSSFSQFSGTTQLRYALTRRNSWGIGAGYTWVGFSDSNTDDIFVNAGASHTVRVFASWSYAFSNTMSFQVSGGPARVIPDRRKQTLRVYPGPLVAVDADLGRPVFRDVRSCVDNNDGTFQEPCSAVPGSALVVDDSEVAAKTSFNDAGELAAEQKRVPSNRDANGVTDTFFAEARLVKRWKRFTFSAAYRRTQNPETSSGTTSIVDGVRASINFKPDRKWNLSASAGWNQRESSNEQTVESRFIFRDSGLLGRPVDDPGIQPAISPVAEVIGQEFKVSNQGLDVTQYNVTALASRRITDELKGSIRFTGRTQKSRSKQSGVTNDFDEFRFTIGFSYTFRPRVLF